MDGNRFEDVVEETFDVIRSVLTSKGKEYTLDTDRLLAFKTSATMQGMSPEQVLGGYMAKHVISLYDMISNGGDFSAERWDEKIIDNINYLILLRALLEDMKSEKTGTGTVNIVNHVSGTVGVVTPDDIRRVEGMKSHGV